MRPCASGSGEGEVALEGCAALMARLGGWRGDEAKAVEGVDWDDDDGGVASGR